MRHLFDQYDHPENRLTHALVSSLANDPKLLKKFVQWAIGEKPPSSQLTIVEQTLPGDEEPQEESEAEDLGLPDGWIYDADGWCLVIESKIESPLKRDQLERHRRTAERRGFTRIHLLALVTDLPSPVILKGITVSVQKWTKLYCWLLQQRHSKWAGRLASYMEILEQKMVRDNSLREGTLTVFSGIPFGKEEPYNYHEAKRLLRLAMEEFRKRSDLKKELGIDYESKGRSAIIGEDGTGVWDFLKFIQARDADKFTEFPHLTLSVRQERLSATVIVPNNIRPAFRKNLLAGGEGHFCALFREILNNLNHSLKSIEGAAPWVEVLQRHYRARRLDTRDAILEFDLRTAFRQPKGWGNAVKQQQQWLEATYESLANRHSNLELGVGAIFSYEQCPVVKKREILNHVANVWLGCKPLIQALLG